MEAEVPSEYTIKTAGQNELHFRNAITAKFGAVLAGKQRYVDDQEMAFPAEISVDDSIFLPDGRVVLIEVDSANMAKLVTGQYTLLNGLYKGTVDKTLFLAIHYYVNRKRHPHAPYEASRTLKNLKFVQKLASARKWLPYNALHMQDFEKIIKEASSITALIDKVWPEAVPPAKKPSSTEHIKVPTTA